MGLYFIRHGQTQNNVEGKMNPWDDDDILTEVWREQAKNAGDSIKKSWIHFDLVISSNLSRAKDTARIIADIIHYSWDILEDARIREQDAWVFVWKKRDDIKREFWLKDDGEFRRVFRDKKYNQKEDTLEFDARVWEFLEEIYCKYPQKDILLVSHSGTSRALLRHTQKLDFEFVYFQMPWVANCELIDLENYGK